MLCILVTFHKSNLKVCCFYLNDATSVVIQIYNRAFLVAGKTDAMTAVEATLSSLPDEVIASVDVSTKASELELEERKKRLEVIQQQEELIKVTLHKF